jgi:hypothetical protein
VDVQLTERGPELLFSDGARARPRDPVRLPFMTRTPCGVYCAESTKASKAYVSSIAKSVWDLTGRKVDGTPLLNHYFSRGGEATARTIFMTEGKEYRLFLKDVFVTRLELRDPCETALCGRAGLPCLIFSNEWVETGKCDGDVVTWQPRRRWADFRREPQERKIGDGHVLLHDEDYVLLMHGSQVLHAIRGTTYAFPHELKSCELLHTYLTRLSTEAMNEFLGESPGRRKKNRKSKGRAPQVQVEVETPEAETPEAQAEAQTSEVEPEVPEAQTSEVEPEVPEVPEVQPEVQPEVETPEVQGPEVQGWMDIRPTLDLADDKDDEMFCVICLSAGRSHAMVPCGHLCLCARCAPRAGTHCPVCRSLGMVCRIYGLPE